MKKRWWMMFCIFILLGFAFYVLYEWEYIPHKKYTNDDFHIETFNSHVDQDGDGVDDQTDILKSVREYIETKPKYKSKYYASGYPDDEYGVCTDVVAFGLLGAGYDLMELVNEDILANKEDYNIDIIDERIDFRRVTNLKVFFEHNAISLTTDVNEIEAWQGGDIVIFENHIGIVSDKRNKNGVPFLIHHGSPYQRFYEEDVLEKRDDIVGHFRISE
ncbi:DUF1287 domain-containing protein [Fervidibacillus halotolerans]|uniref:DUF1287 domain-containing protein n=1 Tax=Fervidibacillus halotolerans TaxID=2980027 RepID=A0A9E8LZG8_9BACI|nr:DUF1287 domain-containing protein [Fervidibacillus halotolerans]WAA12673.1 DUF1287 domain-containing protein [Fervidibacillus halotolerans]